MHAVRDGIEVCCASLQVNAWFEFAQERASCLVWTDRQPEIRAKSIELQGHDTD